MLGPIHKIETGSIFWMNRSVFLPRNQRITLHVIWPLVRNSAVLKGRKAGAMERSRESTECRGNHSCFPYQINPFASVLFSNFQNNWSKTIEHKQMLLCTQKATRRILPQKAETLQLFSALFRRIYIPASGENHHPFISTINQFSLSRTRTFVSCSYLLRLCLFVGSPTGRRFLPFKRKEERKERRKEECVPPEQASDCAHLML